MEYISIRSLQHYLYCPHRWGLLEIERSWEENVFVIKANMIHERAHSGEIYSLRAKKTYTNVDIWNDELGLIGKTDCIEFRKDGVCIVEYKPTEAKDKCIRHEDAMQLFAQKLCVDSVFGIDSLTEIYYADTRKRYLVDFEPGFYEELVGLLSEIRACIEHGIIPKIRKGQKCSGCSMKDLCMPELQSRRKKESVFDIIQKECEA